MHGADARVPERLGLPGALGRPDPRQPRELGVGAEEEVAQRARGEIRRRDAVSGVAARPREPCALSIPTAGRQVRLTPSTPCQAPATPMSAAGPKRSTQPPAQRIDRRGAAVPPRAPSASRRGTGRRGRRGRSARRPSAGGTCRGGGRRASSRSASQPSSSHASADSGSVAIIALFTGASSRRSPGRSAVYASVARTIQRARTSPAELQARPGSIPGPPSTRRSWRPCARRPRRVRARASRAGPGAQCGEKSPPTAPRTRTRSASPAASSRTLSSSPTRTPGPLRAARAVGRARRSLCAVTSVPPFTEVAVDPLGLDDRRRPRRRSPGSRAPARAPRRGRRARSSRRASRTRRRRPSRRSGPRRRSRPPRARATTTSSEGSARRSSYAVQSPV